MFDVAPTELLLIGAVAIAVIPPKDLPRAMRFAGQWIGKARGMARHFRSGLDEMIRQAELDEIEKKWRDENERIMREHPLETIDHAEGSAKAALPAPDDATPLAPDYNEPELAGTVGGGTELPAPVPIGNATPLAENAGPELPLGLPPKQ